MTKRSIGAGRCPARVGVRRWPKRPLTLFCVFNALLLMGSSLSLLAGSLFKGGGPAHPKPQQTPCSGNVGNLGEKTRNSPLGFFTLQNPRSLETLALNRLRSCGTTSVAL